MAVKAISLNLESPLNGRPIESANQTNLSGLKYQKVIGLINQRDQKGLKDLRLLKGLIKTSFGQALLNTLVVYLPNIFVLNFGR